MSSQKAIEPLRVPARSERLETLERGLRVLALFGVDDMHEFTMAEIAERLEISRASALRILGTLEQLGFVHSSGRSFRLSVRVLEIGYAYLSSRGFGTVVKPIMERLVQETGETCSIAVLDDMDVVYVARAEARRIVRIDLNVGSRLPAYLNSMGRLLLGALSDIELDGYLERLDPFAVTDKTVTDKRELKRLIIAARHNGWSYINGEVESRVAGLSVPLRDREGRTTAALNISLMNQNAPGADIEATLLPKLRSAAAPIERILHQGLPPQTGRS